MLQLFLATISFVCLQAKDMNAQEILSQPVTINAENVTLKKVLETIEKQVHVQFTYSQELVDTKQKVTIIAKGQNLKSVFEQLFKPLSIKYTVFNDRTVVLTKMVDTITGSIDAPPVKGKIMDKDGNPLIGATVQIKGSNTGTVTDIDGNFALNCNTGDVLVISYTGYETQEVTVAGGDVNITLAEATNLLDDVVVVGSRFSKPRTDVDRPVAVDVINARELQNSGQVDLGQTIAFSAPSFNAVKFGINDAAPFVDPATLRGLGPDQVLMLVNNKRRHKVSFISINDGVGKGQVGTDINAVPALSLKRVEVLRDGAAAQYGSDAIAGVINMELNDSNEGGTVSVFMGNGYSKPNLDVTNTAVPKLLTDGFTYNLAANVGMKLAKKGFLNTTLTYSHTDGYDRSGTFKSSSGFYVKDAVQDAALVAQNNIDLDRAILGAAENTNIGIFINAGLPINDNWNFYTFGGYTTKHVVTGVFTRAPTNSKRSVLSIFPNGYNPIAPADLQDFSLTAGVKGKLGSWNSDFSVSQGSNVVDWYAENTVNPSLGDASPTEFYIGQTKVGQTLANIDISKTYGGTNYPNLSVGVGSEFRNETFGQKAGDPESYEAGPLFLTKDVGSSGREGFSDRSAGNWSRTNVGVYVEAESDITKNFLVGTAIRLENYSDFGSNFSYKVNSRLRIAEPFAIRGSVSRGFRAPSMVQTHYSNYVNISFDNEGNSIINPIIPADSELAKLLGVDGLEQETSIDFSGGVTSKIGNNLTLTADVYQIDVNNRIMLSGGIDVSGFPEFVAAGFPQTANTFVNAIDTRTRGLEVVANYRLNIGDKSKLIFNAAYSSMVTTLRANRKTSTGVEVADKVATIYITDGLPKSKLIASVNYDLGKFGLMVRGSQFGEVSDPLATLAVAPTDPTIPNYQVFPSKTLVDVSVSYSFSEKLRLSLGVNNVADVYPDLLEKPQTTNEVIYSRRTNQFGTQGRFLNGTITYKF